MGLARTGGSNPTAEQLGAKPQAQIMARHSLELTGDIFATLTGSDPSQLVSQTITRKDTMEKQTDLLGISSWAWCVIGLLGLAAGAMLILALLLFGLPPSN